MQWNFQKGLMVKYLIHWTLKWYGTSLSWFMCLPPLSQLIHLLNSFLCLFSSYFIYPTLFQYFYLIFLKHSLYIIVIICYNAYDDRPVRNVLCTEYIHAYNRLLKMGIISCKNNPPPFSTYNELIVGCIYILLFRYIKIIEWNTMCNVWCELVKNEISGSTIKF